MSKPAPEPALVALHRRMTEGFNLIHRELAAQRAEHAAVRVLIADLGARIEEQGRQLGARIERNRTEIHVRPQAGVVFRGRAHSSARSIL